MFALPLLQITSYSSTYSSLFPLIAIAIMFDAAIVGGWYMVGAVLGNTKVKSSAMGEFYQVFGTALLVVILAGILVIFGNTFYSVTSSTTLMGTNAIGTMCSNLNSNSLMPLISAKRSEDGNSLLYSKSGFPGLCNVTSSQKTFTSKIDYPLAVSGIVIANETNQTMGNLNSYFIFDAFAGFLEKLTPSMAICISPNPNPLEPISIPCVLPIPGLEPDTLIRYTLAPFNGLGLIYKSISSLGALLTMALESFVAQLTLTSIFIYIWPYLLFAGIILRATPFTRKIGGLLIAIAIGGILFFPLIFSIEYLSLGNGLGTMMGYTPPSAAGIIITPSSYSQNDIGAYYGFGGLFTNTTYFIPNTTDTTDAYVTNFYVQPNLGIAASNPAAGCYPSNGNLLTAEEEDTTYLLIPFTGMLEQILALANHAIPNSIISGISGLPQGCTESQALNTYFIFLKGYGVMGISAYFLPLINIIIVLSGIIGLSGLMGGDTTLAGLSRLV